MGAFSFQGGTGLSASPAGRTRAMTVNSATVLIARLPRAGGPREAGQGLAAEAQRGDAEEFVGAAQLAGGVAGEGQRQVVGGDAAAVVGHADRVGAAALDLEVDAGAAGVDGVFQEFFEDTGGALDDL